MILYCRATRILHKIRYLTFSERSPPSSVNHDGKINLSCVNDPIDFTHLRVLSRTWSYDLARVKLLAPESRSPPCFLLRRGRTPRASLPRELPLLSFVNRLYNLPDRWADRFYSLPYAEARALDRPASVSCKNENHTSPKINSRCTTSTNSDFV